MSCSPAEDAIVIRYESFRYDSYPTDNTSYQSWLRRRIAKLEAMQCRRIELVAEQKKQLDASVDRAQREIDNLRAQQTIRGL